MEDKKRTESKEFDNWMRAYLKEHQSELMKIRAKVDATILRDTINCRETHSGKPKTKV